MQTLQEMQEIAADAVALSVEREMRERGMYHPATWKDAMRVYHNEGEDALRVWLDAHQAKINPTGWL